MTEKITIKVLFETCRKFSGGSAWFDGLCNKCGCLVFERGGLPIADYKNFCSNPNCEEHKWHYVGDQEGPEYYKHGVDYEKESNQEENNQKVL